MGYTIGQKIRAVYWIGIYKPNLGGFRSERVSAELEVISPGRAKVVKASLEPAHSDRQWFNASYVASKEVGVIKIISRLWNVEAIE